MAAPIDSPCRNICKLDAQGRVCTGCGRTLEEIAGWTSMGAAERAVIMARVQAAGIKV